MQQARTGRIPVAARGQSRSSSTTGETPATRRRIHPGEPGRGRCHGPGNGFPRSPATLAAQLRALKIAGYGFVDAWAVAPTLVNLGYDNDALSTLVASFSADQF